MEGAFGKTQPFETQSCLEVCRFSLQFLEGWIRDVGKGAFGMWAFKAHHGLSKPIVGFFFQKNGPHIFGSPELLGTLPQALFFSEKWPPYFYKP